MTKAKSCRTCHRELIGEEILGGQCFVCRSEISVAEDSGAAFLESSRIVWSRDWDAVLVGFVLGLLIALVAWSALGHGMEP